jgi:hypothetical protein
MEQPGKQQLGFQKRPVKNREAILSAGIFSFDDVKVIRHFARAKPSYSCFRNGKTFKKNLKPSLTVRFRNPDA